MKREWRVAWRTEMRMEWYGPKSDVKYKARQLRKDVLNTRIQVQSREVSAWKAAKP